MISDAGGMIITDRYYKFLCIHKGDGHHELNKGLRQLYTAIMLFITAKDSILKPETPIFKVKERVEADMYSDVELRDVKAVNTILYWVIFIRHFFK